MQANTLKMYLKTVEEIRGPIKNRKIVDAFGFKNLSCGAVDCMYCSWLIKVERWVAVSRKSPRVMPTSPAGSDFCINTSYKNHCSCRDVHGDC